MSFFCARFRRGFSHPLPCNLDTLQNHEIVQLQGSRTSNKLSQAEIGRHVHFYCCRSMAALRFCRFVFLRYESCSKRNSCSGLLLIHEHGSGMYERLDSSFSFSNTSGIAVHLEGAIKFRLYAAPYLWTC